MAQARLNRPTTPAGALDTYAKALLCDNPIYYAMACPQLGSWQAGLLPRQVGEDFESSLFGQAGFQRWSRPAWQAIWHVYSFLPDGAGGYTGLLLFIDATEPSLGLGQQVAVRPDGDYWTVTPTTDLTQWLVADGEDSLFFFPNATLPHTTYTAQVDGLTVEVDFQCLLGVDNTIVLSTGGFFGGTDSKQDPLPRPSTPFTHLRTSASARLTRTDTGAALGERVELTCAALEGRALEQRDPQAALDGGSFDFTIELGPDGEELSQSGGGIYDGEGVSLSCAPAALAFSFTHEGQEYTGIAWPEEDLS